MEKFSDWLIARLSEKSTQTAGIGLLSILLTHATFISPDIVRELTGFLIALLVTSAATKG